MNKDERVKKLEKDYHELKRCLKVYAGSKTAERLEALLQELWDCDERHDLNIMERLIEAIKENIDAAL